VACFLSNDQLNRGFALFVAEKLVCRVGISVISTCLASVTVILLYDNQLFGFAFCDLQRKYKLNIEVVT